MRNNGKYPRTEETFGGWFGPYVNTAGNVGQKATKTGNVAVGQQE